MNRIPLIVLLVGLFAVPGAFAHADYVHDYYAASTWATTTSIEANGQVVGSFGSYFVDVWRTGFATPTRCASGSSFSSGSDIDNYIGGSFNNCGTLLTAYGSTTLRGALGGSPSFQIFQGIWGSDFWEVAAADHSTPTGVVSPSLPPPLPPLPRPPEKGGGGTKSFGEGTGGRDPPGLGAPPRKKWGGPPAGGGGAPGVPPPRFPGGVLGGGAPPP